jgi:glycosyltransferase involved in cell wall biosynthesis
VKSLKEFELTNDHQHKKNSEKFKMLELDVFNTVDIIYPFSTVEEEIIKKLVPQKIVKALPVYFFDEPVKNVPPFSQRRDILFVGGFGHPPNIDAVLWFVNEVFPLVSRSIPGIVLNVVGSNPPKEILNLKSDSVNVTGYVSDEDLVEFYRKCRISVLPLRVGAGVKGKLLEAMYHRVPTVITPVAAEGVYHIDSHSIIASTPAEFAKGISRLYNDEKAWIEYSKKGNDLIHNNYTELNAQKILEQDIK